MIEYTMSDKKTNLIWIDLEMTGLMPDSDRIIELATVVTDKDLNIIAHGPELVIKQNDSLLAGMDAWNIKHHTASGLLDKVKLSDISEKEAMQQTLDFLSKHVSPGVSPMCGNSICQDRRFLYKYMPELESFFHYRHLDVSTIKILAKNWAPVVYSSFNKHSEHRALDDILLSIAELMHYKQEFFKC